MTHLGHAAVRTQILARIVKLRPESQALWGRMSAHQMLCHLADSFRVLFGERQVSSATGPLQRTVAKWLALYLPLRWPKGIPTRPEVEQGAGGTPPREFEQDRAELISLLQRFTDPKRRFNGSRHPIFGPMRHSEWLRWGFLHTDHHLRQFGV